MCEAWKSKSSEDLVLQWDIPFDSQVLLEQGQTSVVITITWIPTRILVWIRKNDFHQFSLPTAAQNVPLKCFSWEWGGSRGSEESVKITILSAEILGRFFGRICFKLWFLAEVKDFMYSVLSLCVVVIACKSHLWSLWILMWQIYGASPHSKTDKL